MARTKKTYSLDPSVAAMLDDVDNASEYISRVVEQRWQGWIDALGTLAASGWTRAEILAGCDALNGTWLVGPYRMPQAIALELHDFGALNGGAAKWEVADSWAARVREVGGRPEVAYALDTIAREFWSGNTVCEQAIDRVGRAEP